MRWQGRRRQITTRKGNVILHACEREAPRLLPAILTSTSNKCLLNFQRR